MTALLEAHGLVKTFGSFHAVDGVDLTVAEGTIHAVIGPNGAGKSTLFRLLTGVYPPTSGKIRLADKDLTKASTHRVARSGLVQVFQITNIFPRLSILESVTTALLARDGSSTSVLSRKQRRLEAEASDLLGEVGLGEVARNEARTLSHGDQRALEVAMALASGPRLLLLDEPTAGMSPFETERMVELVRSLNRSRQLTVLLSEHDMDIVFDVSEIVTVLHFGKVIMEGTPDAVSKDEQVMAVYLGGER